jgi:hypothetical protein
MDPIYFKIWELAQPYYEQGRPMDIAHIKWMMRDAFLVCQMEKIDDSLLLPLVILHDVGYAKVPKDNPFNLDLRKAHMEEGAKIAKEILEKVDYPKDKVEKIVYYVSVHDNWAFGDDEVYKNDIILGVFNDLDFMWLATEKGFVAIADYLKLNHKAMLEYIKNDEKLINRPLSTKTTQKLFANYIEERKEESKWMS